MNVLPTLTAAGSASSALASLPGSASDTGAPSLFSTFVAESSHLKPATEKTPSAAPADGLSSSELPTNTQAAASTLAEILEGSLFSPRPDDSALVPFLTTGQVDMPAPAVDVLSPTLPTQVNAQTAPGQIWQMGANAPAPSAGPPLPALPAQAKAETAPGQLWQMGADAPAPSVAPPHPSLPTLPGNAKAETAPGQLWQMGADAPAPSVGPPHPSLPTLPVQAKADPVPAASKPMVTQVPVAPNAPLTIPTSNQAQAVASTPTPLPADLAPADFSPLQDQDGANSGLVGTDQSTTSKSAPAATDILPAATDAKPVGYSPLASPALGNTTLGSAGVVPANVVPAHLAGSGGSSQADGAIQALESSKVDRNAAPSPSADGNGQGAAGNGTDQNGPRTQLPASALRPSETEPTTTNAIPRPPNPTASAPIAHAEPAAAAAPPLQANILGTAQTSLPQLPGDTSSFAAGINTMAGGETTPLRLVLSPPTPAASASNMEAVAMRIAHRSSMGESQFDIRLDPPELGRIQVRLEVDLRGQTQVQLSADRPQTLELLQRDSSMLERALRNAGFELSGGLNFSLGREGRQASEQGAEHMPDQYARIDAVSDAELSPSAALAQWSGRTIGEVGHLDIRI